MRTSAPLLCLSLLAASAAAGCGGGGAEGRGAGPIATAATAPMPPGELLLPSEPGPLAPTLARIENAPSAARLAERASVERCAPCHRDSVEAFRGSAHAHASFSNPWYRQAVRAFREEVGLEQSRFCAGCHDPLLLASGAMSEPIDPEDPLTYAGVSCLVCHRITETRADGSASYTLDLAEAPLPRPTEPASVEAHRRAFAPAPLRSAALCGSCHRGFLGPEMGNPTHLAGVDELSPWLGSGYAGQRAARLDTPVEARDCRGCHMPPAAAPEGDRAAEAGMIASHRFAGAHTAMAASLGGGPQLEAQRALLLRAARLDLASLRVEGGGGPSLTLLPLPATGAPLRGGARTVLDLVVRNLGVGHRFPGGLRDAQDCWIEVELRDADGALLLEAGLDHERGEDPSAAQLRALAVDAEARPSLLHRVHLFRGAVADTTLLPRDARLFRYAFVPPGEGPYLLRARLRHRSHELVMQRAACEEERGDEGAPFQRGAQAAPSACATQPITTLAEAVAWIGRGSEGRAGATPEGPPVRRLFELGLALGGQLQERLGEAEGPLLAGLEVARAQGDPAAAALFHGQLARVRGGQGRLEEALREAAAAEATVGPHPALDRLRGEAYAQVWRWPEAAAAFARAATVASGDPSLWAALARAWGSAGEDRRSLLAARRGLRLSPRSESLLRSQALALRALGSADAEDAEDAYLAQRAPDELSSLRFRCAREQPGCARIQLPAPTFELGPPTPVGVAGSAEDRRRAANSPR